MAKRTRYIVSCDAFNNPYVLDTKKVRNSGPRVKYTMTWDAFLARPKKAAKPKGGAQ